MTENAKNPPFPGGAVRTVALTLRAKLVSKTLRSLPQRFAYKVTAIEEAKNVQAMRLDELMGSLRTFEMNLDQNKKEKETAFQAKVQKLTVEEDIGDPQALDVSNNGVAACVTNDVGTSSIIQSEKPEENGDISDSDSFSNDGELTQETIQDAYESMFNKWIQVVKLNKSLEKKLADAVQENESLKMKHEFEIAEMHEFEIAEMRKRLQEANAELERTQKTLKMMNTGTAKLDHILSMGKSSHDHFGLGYSGECQSSNSVFVKEKTQAKTKIPHSKTIIHASRQKPFIPICYYCSFPGHIRPQCYKYLNALKQGMHLNSPNVARKTPRRKIDGDNRSTRKVWVRKSDLRFYVAYTFLKASTTNSWYFDSGCSRHMTGERSLLKNFKSLTDGHVTFGDGVKGRVLGRGTLDVDGLPKLKNVLLVKGLKANLISISQLCDQELFVSFSKNKCRVMDEEENCVMEGSRSSYNCYMSIHPLSYFKTTKEEIEVESIGGRKYIFVCVDDFSRFTWVDFIREKSDTFKDSAADEVTLDVGTSFGTQMPEQEVEDLDAANQMTREPSSRIKRNHPAEEVIGE
ncbi:uncharacterized protein LOC112091153 [Morus notabilis]|uniref:uncharacterized protein LOC112091153 n=1 Tax=Morus notabilis TaxID=981085 RepID=UPI000CED1B30|nr:uncharacterized protein LOC112091153 [Morus notabilis]